MNEVPALDWEEYGVALDFQSGWVNLSLEDFTKSGAARLGEIESDRFNPMKLVSQKRHLARELAKKAYDARVEGNSLRASLYTDEGGCLVDLHVNLYAEEGESPTPSDVEPMLLSSANAELASEPDIGYLDLPAGPAVRVHGVFKSKKILGFGQSLVEVIRYAVCPNVNSDVVVVGAVWENFEFSDEIIPVVDELIPTLKLVTDKDGQEYCHPRSAHER